MPTYPSTFSQPVYWNVWGHSYFNNAFGPRNVYGRIDGFFRSLIPIGYGDFANYAVTGARLSVEGQSQGGYAKVINNITQLASSTGPSGPAVSQMGAHIFCYGINDLGFNGDTSQYNTAYAHAMRAVISRARMSYLRPCNYAGAAGTGTIAYSGYTTFATTGEFSTGTSIAITTTAGTSGQTVTYTLPSDYNGETIASLWIANPGVAGGTLTVTGTAVAGTSYSGATFSTSNIMPSASLNHSPVCYRIKGLTSANASQTIIFTVTAIDAASNVCFDSIWGEAFDPPPVIWCNTPRLTSTGYAIYPPTIGDVDVQAFNAAAFPVIAEFDEMVQWADIDSAIAKDPVALIYDGLHPNEVGGALCAQAIQAALQNCSYPTSKYGMYANLQPPGPRYAQVIRVHAAGNWYCTDAGGPSGTNYTPAAGDLIALPLLITSASRRVTQWSMQCTSTSTGATTVWFGIYDDRAFTGYPVNKYLDTTGTSAISLPTTAAVFNSTTTSTNQGYISYPFDPGLWWLVILIGTVSTPSPLQAIKGPSLIMPNLATTGGQFGATSSPVAWKLTGQGNAVLPKTFPSGGALLDNAPLIGVKMA